MNRQTELCLIAALSRRRLIGNQGALPWHLPRDLQLFKSHTSGKTIIMGRKTFESIGRPLPHRRNLVLSRSNFEADGVEVYADIKSAIAAADSEVMVIGGGEIYRLCLEKATRLLLSVVDGDFEGDAFFPPLTDPDWLVTTVQSFEADDRNEHRFTFMELRRSGRPVMKTPEFLYL